MSVRWNCIDKVFYSVIITVIITSLGLALLGWAAMAQEPDYDAQINQLLQQIQTLQTDKVRKAQEAQKAQIQPETQTQPQPTIFLKCNDGQGNQVPCSIHIDPEVQEQLNRIEQALKELKAQQGTSTNSGGALGVQ
jgi:hypothetical protein